jgi:hypothetical protein
VQTKVLLLLKLVGRVLQDAITLHNKEKVCVFV